MNTDLHTAYAYHRATGATAWQAVTYARLDVATLAR